MRAIVIQQYGGPEQWRFRSGLILSPSPATS
jgi:hypothetical protein